MTKAISATGVATTEMSRRGGLLIALVAVAGCWSNDDDAPALPEGNATLGIVRFVEEEVGDQTSLRGLDVNGNEVARLDLVHGLFAVTPPFTDEYSTPEVDGRKLNVHALGQRMHWETAGFDPVLQMPAQPSSHWAIAALVADPHAKRILDRWQIGFDPFQAAGNGEVSYASSSFRGHSQMNCNGLTTCGTAFLGTINTCPGAMSGAGITAARVTQQPGTNCGLYTGPTNPEVRVAQCCPSTTGLLGVPWYAEKVCPTTNTTSTSCGTVPSGACKGCPTYPADATTGCSVSVGSTVGTCNGAVYPVNASFMGSFYDDFNRTTGMGPSWTVYWGSYPTDGAVATSQLEGGHASTWASAIPSPALGTNNYSVTTQMSVPGVDTLHYPWAAGVYARNSGTNQSTIVQSMYAAQISTENGGGVHLLRRNNTNWTSLGTVWLTIVPGTPYTLKLVTTGSNPTHLELWLDGALKISYDDFSPDQLLTGAAGVLNWDTGVKYDSFQIDAALVPAPPPPGVIDRMVVASADDAEENASNGSMNLTSSDLEMVNDSSTNQRVGMRFTSMTIPPGATITRAYVQFTADSTAGSTGLNLTIKGFAQDNTAAFTSSTNSISSRPVTTAAVTGWNPPLWTAVGAAGVDQQTPELKTIVQEIVNRPGWVLGNALGLVVTGPSGVRNADSIDGSGTPAVLHVEYTTGNVAPTVSAGPDQIITLPASANLDGAISDDGLPNPPAAVTASWTKVSGPGTVTFGNASAVDTTATFSAAGVYVLRLTGSDSTLSTSDDAQITVNASPPPGGTTSVTASADAKVEQWNPTTSYPSVDLRVEALTNDDIRSYLKFPIALPAGSTITSASLKLWCFNSTTNGPRVYNAANTTWVETSLTWSNQPGSTGASLADIGNASCGSGTWITVSLNPATIPINGTFSIVLMPDSSDGADFQSREDPNQPTLELTYQ